MELGKQAGLRPYDLPLRNVFGDALLNVAAENPRVVVLDGDLANSTKADTVRKAYPERFFNIGIAESNLVGIGAGLAACDFIPWITSFSSFLLCNAYDQIRLAVAMSNINAKILGSHGGITPDGAAELHARHAGHPVIRKHDGDGILVQEAKPFLGARRRQHRELALEGQLEDPEVLGLVVHVELDEAPIGDVEHREFREAVEWLESRTDLVVIASVDEAIEQFRAALAIDEKLGSIEGRAYDLMVLDAFAGDAVPTEVMIEALRALGYTK